MKKWATILSASLLALVLTACNSTAEPVQETEGNETTEATTKTTELSELTLEEVYENAIKRQNEMKSVSADMKLDQTITFGSGEESYEMGTKSDMKMDMVVNPLAMYMDGSMTMADPESGEDMVMDMEMYMNENGMYMHESQTQQWMKLPMDNFDAIMGQTANQANAGEQLKELKSFINDFKFEQTEDAYILTLNATGEKFNEYILEQMQVYEMVGTTEENQQLFENLNYEKVNYVITINKETFDITEMDMVIDMTMNIEGESMGMAMDTNIVFSNFDGVEEITVPQEVIDQAVEVNY